MKNQFPSNIICCEYKLTVISLILKDTYPGRDPRGKVTWPGTASLSDRSWPSSSGPRPSHGKGWQCLTVERIKSQQTLKLQKSLYLCSHAHIRSCDFYQNNEKNYSKYKCTLKCIFCLIMSENGVTMNYRYMHMFNTVRS